MTIHPLIINITIMTSFRFHFRSPDGPDKPGTLFIRLILRRKYRDLRRGYPVYSEEWDPVRRRLVIPCDAENGRTRHLLQLEEMMNADLERLSSILRKLSAAGEYGLGDIVDEFNGSLSPYNLLSFSSLLSRELEEQERHRTARAYRCAAKKLAAFAGSEDLKVSDITPKLIRAFERHLLDNGLQMNTISFYMRNIRAIYYRAVKANLIRKCESNPFEDVYTGVYETRRRALDQKEMNSLVALGKKIPAGKRNLRHALMYFLFAYHSRGMSFIDLAHLKKSDIKGDTIRYKRRKTGFFLQVRITKPMKRIIGYFKKETNRSPYVFPIMAEGVSHPSGYEAALNRQNRLLKEISLLAGITSSLSTHVARHTWATLAKRMGYGIMLIGEGLGHRDPKVTSIYLASFERSEIDELSNRLSRFIEAA